MSARSVVIGQHERGVIRATDSDLLIRETHGRPGQVAAGHHQLLRRRPAAPAGPGRLCGLSRPGPRLLPLPALPAAGNGRAEQVRAHDTYRSDDEEPQDGKERQPDEGQGKRIHLVICPRWPLLPLLVSRRRGADGSLVCAVSVNSIPAEDKGGPAQGDARAVRQGDAAHRLAVDEGAVGGAQVDEHDLAVLDAQLGVMARDTRINEAQVTVRATAEYGQRRTEFVGALRVPVRPWLRPGDEQPRGAGKAARRVREITGGAADLAAP